MNEGYTGIFVDENGYEVKVTHLAYEGREDLDIHYRYIGNGVSKALPSESFNRYFKKKATTATINQDIINLIKSGYEFKSFSGYTLDNRYLNIDLES